MGKRKIMSAPRTKKEEQKVPLNHDVMMKCMCGMCSVQADSECIRPKLTFGSMSAMPVPMGEIKMLKPKEFAGLYCSIGKAGCNDLDNSKACACNQCQVYKDQSLMDNKPAGYFCFNGKARLMSAIGIFKRTGAPKFIAKDSDGFLTVQITLDGQPDWDWMECFKHPSTFIPNEAYPSRATVLMDTIIFKSLDANVKANIEWMDKYIQQANDSYTRARYPEIL